MTLPISIGKVIYFYPIFSVFSNFLVFSNESENMYLG